MTQQSYLNTLLNIIDHHDYYKVGDYTEALEYLFNKPFTPMYSDDMNRLEDAVDFRMRHGFRDKDIPISAKDIVNPCSEEKLSDIFFKYGEEKLSRVIAKKIVEKRIEKEKKINEFYVFKKKKSSKI